MSTGTTETTGTAGALEVRADNAFELSPRQRELWEWEGSSPRLVHAAIDVRGPLDRERLAAALERLTRRFEILRTGLLRQPDSGRPVQVIGDPYAPPLEVERGRRDVDLRPLPWPAECDAPPAADDGRPLAARLQEQGGGRRRLELLVNAACADAPSMEILFHALVDAMDADGDDAEGAIQYADLAQWQGDLVRDDDAAEEREFWLRRAPLPPVPPLPFVGSSPRPRRCRVRLPLSPTEARLHAALAEELEVEVEDVLAAAWHVALQRSTGDQETLLGIPFDGRPYGELEDAVGPLARHLPLSGRIAPARSFADAVGAFVAARDEAREWGEYFAWELMDDDAPGEEPLPYAFDARRLPAPRRAAGARWELSAVEAAADPFLVCLVCRRDAAGVELTADLAYDAVRLSDDQAERLGKRWRRLLNGACADPSTAVGELPFLHPSERQRLVFELAGEGEPVREPHCLHAAFEEQAVLDPDRPAVEGHGGSLTYGELDRRATRLAHLLCRRGVEPGDRVAILLGRSPRMIVAALAALKAGAAYVPLDVSYPTRRLAHMLDDSQAACLVTDGDAAASAEGLELGGDGDVPTVRLGAAEDEEELASLPPDVPPAPAEPLAAVYLIYTSGSTGKPKGVVVPHRGVEARIAWIQEHHPLPPGGGVVQKAPFAFDVSVREIFWPLSVGGRVVLADPGSEADPRHLAELLEEHDVDVVHFVPNLLQLFLEAEEGEVDEIDRVICGGEAMPPGARDAFFASLDDGTDLHNSYGPTEASIHATFWTCGREDGEPFVPIGSPISQTAVYVLNPLLEPAPLVVPGELCVGGPGVARGYEDRPALTAENFVPDPYSEQPGSRLYRTGDLARWLSGGNLQWLGRLDRQVKVRGQRVEMGEVETRLQEHPAVRRAFVTAEPAAGGGGELVAYVVRDEGALPDLGDLRDFLARELPEFALPAEYRALRTVPRTPTGKVDRAALPEAVVEESDGAPHVAPRDRVEEVLALMWRQALDLDRVSVREDFFAAGGNSLLATRLFSRIRTAFRVDVPLRSLFEAATVEGLANLLRAEEPSPGHSERVADKLMQIKGGKASADEAQEVSRT